MTDTAVLTSVRVSVADYDSGVLDAARGVLEGYTDDYYFFQYDDDTWFLLLYDRTDSDIDGSFMVSLSNCTVVQIDRRVVDVPYSVSHSISGTIISELPGRFEGSYVTTEHRVTTNYFISIGTANSVSVANPDGYLVYGSAPNMPHLIEGVQNYAYMQTLLTVGVILFVLADRIFRRVY